ncbi:uncharacterized protein TNCV_4831631 [Trichonephila clavipes]|nr:uncharacterized protein TNCV_4831631 [Trichonephila clavipes]
MGKKGDLLPCKKAEVNALVNAKLFSNHEISPRSASVMKAHLKFCRTKLSLCVGRRGEKFHSDCVVQTVKHTTKIMISSVIRGKGTGRLYVIKAGVFSEAVKGLQCGAKGLNLSCEENCSGGAFELGIICDFCSYSYKFCSSKKCKAEIGKPSTYEINTRIVYAMRCIGKGAEAARMFCGIMNLQPPPTMFSKYNKMLLGATKDVSDATMKDAVEEAVHKKTKILGTFL